MSLEIKNNRPIIIEFVSDTQYEELHYSQAMNGLTTNQYCESFYLMQIERQPVAPYDNSYIALLGTWIDISKLRQFQGQALIYFANGHYLGASEFETHIEKISTALVTKIKFIC